MKKLMIIGLLLLTTACRLNQPLDEKKGAVDIEDPAKIIDTIQSKGPIINEAGETIEERFILPEGFHRVVVKEDSFESYLRNLTLKPHGTKVLYFDGSTKNKSNVYIAVVDMDVGNRDLQQCADAIIRLRAEYLYQKKEYDSIHFNFTNGFRVDYTKWMEGYRIAINGNNTSWVKRTEASNTYQDFRKYLDIVFAYAGTLSLEQELESVAVQDLQIGDIFIQGGSPGHAIIVVDMIENTATGEKRFLVAQSYMPAQETQVLVNPMDNKISPWYSSNFGDTLQTPEWTFSSGDLKRFK